MAFPDKSTWPGVEVQTHPHASLSQDGQTVLWNGQPVDGIRRFASLSEYVGDFRKSVGKVVLPVTVDTSGIVAGYETYDPNGDHIDRMMERELGLRQGEYFRTDLDFTQL